MLPSLTLIILAALSQINEAIEISNSLIPDVGDFKFKTASELFSKHHKPIDFSALKTKSNFELSKLIDKVVSINGILSANLTFKNTSNVSSNVSPKRVVVKPVKVLKSNFTSLKQTFASLKIVGTGSKAEVVKSGPNRGVFDRASLPAHHNGPSLASLLALVTTTQPPKPKKVIFTEHKVVIIKTKFPIKTYLPFNLTTILGNLSSSLSSTLSTSGVEINKDDIKNITTESFFNPFNITNTFSTALNSTLIPTSFSGIIGWLGKKKMTALVQQRKREPTTTHERLARQFGSGFGGAGFAGAGFGESNFNNNNAGFGGFGGGNNFNNNNGNFGGFGGFGENFNNNNAGFGGNNFNNNNGK